MFGAVSCGWILVSGVCSIGIGDLVDQRPAVRFERLDDLDQRLLVGGTVGLQGADDILLNFVERGFVGQAFGHGDSTQGMLSESVPALTGRAVQTCGVSRHQIICPPHPGGLVVTREQAKAWLLECEEVLRTDFVATGKATADEARAALQAGATLLRTCTPAPPPHVVIGALLADVRRGSDVESEEAPMAEIPRAG